MKIILPILFVVSMHIGTQAQVSLPYSQDFEGNIFPPANWQTFPIGSLVNWIRDTSVSGYGIGTACASFDNYNTAGGGYYGIRFPSMNFTGITNPWIRFDIAYAPRTTSTYDIFGLWWSNNGSSNWLNLHNWTGSPLASAPATTARFVPTDTQWKTIAFSLASLAGLPYVRLAIEDDCNHSNMIYFDNVIVFDSLTTNVNENNPESQYLVSLNPATNELTIRNNTLKSESIYFALYNSVGEKLIEQTLEDKINLIDLSIYPDNIYIYELTSGNKKIKTGKLIRQ